MADFICPVCGQCLVEKNTRFFCPSGHSFDRARSGYVNLLPNVSFSKNHGDDKEMLVSRRNFLQK